MNANLIIFLPVGLAILWSLYTMLWLKRQPKPNAAMEKISLAIREGSNAYLARQYK